MRSRTPEASSHCHRPGEGRRGAILQNNWCLFVAVIGAKTGVSEDFLTKTSSMSTLPAWPLARCAVKTAIRA